MKKVTQTASIILLLTATILSSCEKWVEVPASKNQIESSIVFEDLSTATSALLGIYYTLNTSTSINFKFVSLYADEYAYTASNATISQFYQSQLLADNTSNASIWNSLFSVVYQCNSLIEGVDNSLGLSIANRNALTAEAKFLRAYANFYLLNLYGHIPLLLSTDVNINRLSPQASAAQVYSQIISDLQEAKTGLQISYLGTGKVRANRLAASAFLARVYLYQQQWQDAQAEASIVINSGVYSPLPVLDDVFVAGSKETILQLWSANGFLADATSFVPSSSTVLPVYTISNNLYQAFDATDGRRSKWIGVNRVTSSGVTTLYNFPNKYKNRIANTAKPEYQMAIRLSEMYLIRAEAAAQLNNTAQAVSDLNVIRTRATGISALEYTLNQQACIQAVESERQRELFGEWGHRLLDLKRTQRIDAVLVPLKSGYKSGVSNLYPIPLGDIAANNRLIQNNGY